MLGMRSRAVIFWLLEAGHFRLLRSEAKKRLVSALQCFHLVDPIPDPYVLSTFEPLSGQMKLVTHVSESTADQFDNKESIINNHYA